MNNPTHTNKKTNIADAALHLFAAKGIKATTIRDIAQAAGVTEGALYRHFDSKEQLAKDLFARCADSAYLHLQQASAEATDTPDRLCAAARAFFDFADRQPEAFEYVMARHYEDFAGLAQHHRLPKDVFINILAEGMAAGELRPMEPTLAAAVAIGMLIRTIVFADRGIIKSDREQIMTELCHALRRVFAPERTD